MNSVQFPWSIFMELLFRHGSLFLRIGTKLTFAIRLSIGLEKTLMMDHYLFPSSLLCNMVNDFDEMKFLFLLHAY